MAEAVSEIGSEAGLDQHGKFLYRLKVRSPVMAHTPTGGGSTS